MWVLSRKDWLKSNVTPSEWHANKRSDSNLISYPISHGGHLSALTGGLIMQDPWHFITSCEIFVMAIV